MDRDCFYQSTLFWSYRSPLGRSSIREPQELRVWLRTCWTDWAVGHASFCYLHLSNSLTKGMPSLPVRNRVVALPWIILIVCRRDICSGVHRSQGTQTSATLFISPVHPPTDPKAGRVRRGRVFASRDPRVRPALNQCVDGCRPAVVQCSVWNLCQPTGAAVHCAAGAARNDGSRHAPSQRPANVPSCPFVGRAY